MESPLALKLNSPLAVEAYQVKIDQVQGAELAKSAIARGPALIVTRNAAILREMSAGVIDAANVVVVADGDWSDALLVVLPNPRAGATLPDQTDIGGDASFLAEVEKLAPALSNLAARTIAAIRAAGVDGQLAKSRLGKWVNQPLNTFTLKVQPRAGNLHFTLYGNPETYRAGDFLLKDQNSYSRGWVRDARDAAVLADLARQSHARRSG